MTDSLGWRGKFAVLIPSTNTSVQPEFDAMRPVGVTNHMSRIVIPDIALESDEDFDQIVRLIAEAQSAAVDAAMSCEPDRLVLGISVETFWNGLQASRDLKRDLEKQSGLRVSMGADACDAAFKLYGVKRVAVITPYWPVGDKNVVRFLEEAGYTVRRIHGMKCRSPLLIAHTSPAQLRDALREVDGDDVDALLQVGTNLACAKVAAEAELWLGKPVFAINTAIYWHALREHGITDKVSGWGSLLERH